MRVQIGDWIADDDTDTLLQGGLRRKLARRTMAVLMDLAAHPGQVRSRDELVLAVWGRHAISDHSVAIVISDLRRAMDDPRDTPVYIETITKRGYRLVAPVSVLQEGAAGDRSLKAIVPGGRRAVLVGATVGLVLIAGAGVGAVWRGRKAAPIALAQFENKTGSPDLDYLVFALGELVAAELATDQAPPVMRWNTGGRSPAENADLRRSIGASGASLVQGRLLLEDGQPVLAVQVSDLDSGRVAWTSSYRVVGSALAPQSRDIAVDLAEATGRTLRRPSRERQAPPEAHEIYWRARYLWNLRNEDSSRRARDLLHDLIRAYPTYAPAHAALADIYAHKSGEALDLPRTDTFAEAQRRLDDARRIGGDSVEVEVTEAILAFYRDRDPMRASAHLRAALRRNERNALAWQTLAMVRSAQGRHDEALAAIDRARSLDAASFSILWDRVWFLYAAARFEPALAAAVEAARISSPMQLYRALIFEALGRRQDALQAWLIRAQDRGLKGAPLVHLREQLSVETGVGAYRALVGVARAHKDAGVPLAVLQLNAGQRGEAVDSLLAAGTPRDGWLLAWLPQMPALRPLRGEPRLQPLIRTMRAYQQV